METPFLTNCGHIYAGSWDMSAVTGRIRMRASGRFAVAGTSRHEKVEAEMQKIIDADPKLGRKVINIDWPDPNEENDKSP